MENTILLPTLSHFQNGNTWLGSNQALRFAIEPEDGERLTVTIWWGQLCRALSEEAGRAEFAMTEDGMEALRDWLHAQ